tara:strand:- start:6850 stop:7839 length:990 start_codon:yes stop_codon:yes gene_type:complete
MKINRSNNLLITGGAGFIGSNFIDFHLQKYPNIRIINLDLLTYAGNLENTKTFQNNSNYTFIKGSICDTELLKDIFKNYKIDGVINFAAESHVDNSIKYPSEFINTNIKGVYALLQTCFDFWFDKPHMPKDNYINARYHQVSTDEVYGSKKNGSFIESDPYSPNSPYSSTKASADMLTRSFNKTYGLNTTISISSNNFGPNQHKEKFIPKIIECINNNNHIPVYGKGLNIRDWLHVTDNCKAIDLIFNEAKSGEKFNVASGNEISNIDLIDLICAISNNQKKISFVKDRYGHDFRYSISTKKINKTLGWKAEKFLKTSLEKYIKHSLKN